jgi:CheY-like chemotaxis protein
MVTSDKNSFNQINVLIVEDDAGHVKLIEKNLRSAGLAGKISVANTDIEAIAMLTDESADALTKKIEPLLIMLDLGIPEKGGLEVLRLIMTNRNKIKTMVIVFSASSDPVEIKNCYLSGCNIFITKPGDYNKFAETIRSLGHFLNYIKFP